MLSFGDMQRECQRRCRDTSDASLTFFKQNIAIGQQILESEINTFVTERTQTYTTTTSNTYNLPDKFIRLKSLYVTIGTQRFQAEPVYDENLWQKLQSPSPATSDQIVKVFVRRNTFEIFPTPATGTYTMTMIFEAESQPLSFDDYTTGTITTLAASGTSVTGSGSSWTSNMAGRFFKIDAEPTWYEISSVTNSTTLVLRSPYQGTAISAGSSAYTIGEMPRTPSATHIIPVLYACWNYYQGAQKDSKFGAIFKKQYEDMVNWAKGTYAKRYASNVIPSQRQLRNGLHRLNPNWYPSTID